MDNSELLIVQNESLQLEINRLKSENSKLLSLVIDSNEFTRVVCGKSLDIIFNSTEFKITSN